MLGLLFDICVGAGTALLVWLVLERVLSRALPRLEGILPSDIVGPGGWFADTATQVGIFDRLIHKRRF